MIDKTKRTCKLCLIALLCALCLGALSAGLVDGRTTVHAEDTAATTAATDDTFLIGSWVSYYPLSIKSFEEQTAFMAQAGLNFNIFPFPWSSSSRPADLDGWYETVDEVYGDLGMKYCVDVGARTPARIRELTGITANLEHCIGYHVVDEPGGTSLRSVADFCKQLHAADPLRTPFVNLLPSYAGSGVLGGSYENYVTNWVRECDGASEYLSHDYYCFGAGGGVNMNIFGDVEVVRKAAYENGKLKTHAFPQSTAWRGMRMPTEDELRWNVYLYVAYGFKALSYFNLVTPGTSDTEGEGFTDSLIHRDGTIRHPELFASFSDLNHEITAMGDVLMRLDCAHAYHTKENVRGVETLPADWYLTPKDKSTDFVVSYMVSKDDSAPHIMLFNKSTTRAATPSFSVDPTSGIEGLEYFDPATKTYRAADISSGTLTDTFRAGEGKLYRIVGELQSQEPLVAPIVDKASGTYPAGERITVTKRDEREDVHYTLDGSFPTVSSPLYTDPIALGTYGKAERVIFRAMSYRGSRHSEVVRREYILNGKKSANIARGKSVTVGGAYAEYYDGIPIEASVLTDGATDTVLATPTNTCAWIALDLGERYRFDSMTISVPDTAAVRCLLVQASDDVDFRTDVTQVFDDDADGITGFGGVAAGDFGDGNITFAPTEARYIRIYLDCGNRTILSEIAVYGRFDAKDDLSAAPIERFTEKGGDWQNEGGAISPTPATGNAYTEGGYVYTGKRYGDFAAEAVFALREGTAGFALYDDARGRSAYFGISAAGVLQLSVDGMPYDVTATASPWDAASFRLKVTRIGTSVTFSVNGTDVFTQNAVDMDFEGNLGLSGEQAAKFTATEFRADPYEWEACTEQAAIETVASPAAVTVDAYTRFADVRKVLPHTLSYTDTDGKSGTADVQWQQGEYDVYGGGGEYLLEGILTPQERHVVNIWGVTAKIRVAVRYDADYSELRRVVARTENLVASDFEKTGWDAMQSYLTAAKAILAEKNAPQNAVTVAAWQLEREVDALQNITFDWEAYDAKIAALEKEDVRAYTPDSYAYLQAMLRVAREVSHIGAEAATRAQEAMTRVDEAVRLLARYGDRAALEALIAQAEAADASRYTKLGYKDLKDVTETAKFVVSLPSVTEQTLACLETLLRNALAATRAA